MHNFKPLAELAIYIHIPFCRSKCYYCDFFSVACSDTKIMKNVIGEIIRQGRYFYEKLGKPLIGSIYVGGGTPSCLPVPELVRLFRFVQDLKKSNGFEFTIEANPESLQAAFLQLCATHGVNRLSVGIQTCQAEQLKLLGRLATSQINRQVLELLGQAWSGRLNLDLIVGLPRQTATMVREDLFQVLKARSGHLSLYALTIEALHYSSR